MAGIEPAYKSFADSDLTTWRHRLFLVETCLFAKLLRHFQIFLLRRTASTPPKKNLKDSSYFNKNPKFRRSINMSLLAKLAKPYCRSDRGSRRLISGSFRRILVPCLILT